ncbi:TIGR02530 family flagellar biosynthesis protein [Paenibacillus methanolicus]|uniref:Flagellar operon protein n=1 Tax=Paenibacillus methanolicus TaxID=582686 RepID=A0A5S5CH35_9BACL|nr:TIGR02530 family flagellar biosynthesis protein [Paenibacillus methanolicus]TYP77650.1 flagellar operon protein [Paenibacillus methanolicus]
MNNRLTIGQLQIGAQGARPLGKPAANPVPNTAFKDMLDSQVLKFSQHAETRMRQRGITLGVDTLSKIEGAIDQAAAKGAKDSLVICKDVAMIVNVPSRTVVTAMDGNSLKNNVFTQIDSAVVIS